MNVENETTHIVNGRQYRIFKKDEKLHVQIANPSIGDVATYKHFYEAILAKQGSRIDDRYDISISLQAKHYTPLWIMGIIVTGCAIYMLSLRSMPGANMALIVGVILYMYFMFFFRFRNIPSGLSYFSRDLEKDIIHFID